MSFECPAAVKLQGSGGEGGCRGCGCGGGCSDGGCRGGGGCGSGSNFGFSCRY